MSTSSHLLIEFIPSSTFVLQTYVSPHSNNTIVFYSFTKTYSIAQSTIVLLSETDSTLTFISVHAGYTSHHNAVYSVVAQVCNSKERTALYTHQSSLALIEIFADHALPFDLVIATRTLFIIILLFDGTV